ncbi:MAG: hypothetical protein QOF59_570 [Actinomycetota bacterium]|nr:hypothetical protein [Actinomycetota bacterium]
MSGDVRGTVRSSRTRMRPAEAGLSVSSITSRRSDEVGEHGRAADKAFSELAEGVCIH